ncbi:MAG: hypothetical protein LBI44_01300 [Oscillospiraceae bacterium]|jgi:NAD(P)H-dependent FMN reductase|nr:hypothetical protein [Oscillospiraceae bacterium]
MSTQVTYYSYGGKTRVIALDVAAKLQAGCEEIADTKRPGLLRAYTAGIMAAVRGKPWPIKPVFTAASACERVILLSPVWAGNPPPAVHAALALLPEGKSVAVKMVSASGKSKCRAAVERAVATRGCVLESFEDIKA